MISFVKKKPEGQMSTSTPITPIPKLPDDAIADILYRLPVKTLMRFRCVCKAWNLMTRNQQFVKLHLSHAAADVDSYKVLVAWSESVAVNEEEDGDQVVTLDCGVDMSSFDEVVVAGSCNGLICLIGTVADHDHRHFLWNPSMRELKESSIPTRSSAHSVSELAYGFGYDASGDDYKIVRSLRTLPAGTDGTVRKFEVEVISLKTNSWRRVEDYQSQLAFSEKGLYSNGALHWLGYRTGERESSAIVSFNLTTENFEEILKLPYHDKSFVSDFTVVGGTSGICAVGSVATDLEVWEMRKYGVKASWTKVVTISFEKEIPPSHYYLRPLSFTKNGEIFINMDERGFLMYNPTEMTFRNRFQDHWDGEEMNLYVESLVSPHDIIGEARD